MTRPRQTRLLSGAGSVALAAAAATAILAVALLAAAVAAQPAFAGPYGNPSPVEVRAKLQAAAVSRSIPPKILYAIAWQESTWRQFTAAGDPLISGDGGIGIMQVTTIPAGVDKDRLTTDIDYNIAVGADILVTKKGYAPSVFPIIGDGDPRCYEHWFFAVWAYNGWVRDNPYPYRIWEHIADGYGLWTGGPVTPYPTSALVNGFPVKVDSVPAPQPEHWWSPTPLPKPELSVPRAQKRVAAGRRFTVSGTLSPRHPAGTHSVELRLYRKSGSRWVLRRTLLTTNRDTGGSAADLTRWAKTLALGKTGRWKLVACALPDADHAARTSKPAYVTVVR
jgi:hypothetical protein